MGSQFVVVIGDLVNRSQRGSHRTDDSVCVNEICDRFGEPHQRFDVGERHRLFEVCIVFVDPLDDGDIQSILPSPCTSISSV